MQSLAGLVQKLASYLASVILQHALSHIHIGWPTSARSVGTQSEGGSTAKLNYDHEQQADSDTVVVSWLDEPSLS